MSVIQKPHTKVPTSPPSDGNRALTPEQATAFGEQIAARKGHTKPNKVVAKVKEMTSTIWHGLCWFGRKIKAATKAVVRAVGWTGRKVAVGAKATGRGLAYVGYGTGRLAHAAFSDCAMVTSWVVGGVVLVGATAVMAVGVGVSYTLYGAVKVVNLIGLTLATPHLALRSRHGDNVLAQRWGAYFDSLRLCNFHKISPLSLTQYSDAETTARIVRGPRLGTKGHSTPKQVKRRPARPPVPATA